MLKIGIAGAAGRMGKLLIKAVLEHEATSLVAISARQEDMEQMHTHLQREGLVNVRLVQNVDGLVDLAEAVIDFTAPEYSLSIANACKNNVLKQIAEQIDGKAKIHICGTTGFDDAQNAIMAQCAKHSRIVRAANFSVGVNLLAKLTKQTAATLGIDYDIEIVEMHHHHKKDAPSGTALALGEAAAAGRNVALATVAEHGRVGMVGERVAGNIGFHALRGGDVIGDHHVIFAGNGERIELVHKSSNRRIYADGAIRAALWASSKPNGLYSMLDVLE